MFSLFRNQPRAFYMLCSLEVWERFGFYTVQGILTLFFMRYLGFTDETAYYTFGAFSALVYGMVAAGGYLGDKILGTKRAIMLGLVVMALGYLALSLANEYSVFYALGLICVGNGMFKANPPNLLSKCYEQGDPRLHSAFTLYYMSINLGSIFSFFIGPIVSNYFGYSYAYFISFIGILLGIATYYFRIRLVAHINTDADRRIIYMRQWISLGLVITLATIVCAYLLQHVIIAKNLVWVVTLIVVGIYFNYMRRENRKVGLRMLLAFILMVEAVVFFTLYQQLPTSITLFAVHNVHANIFSIPVNSQSFRALNPLSIILMSPILAVFYQKLAQKRFDFSMPYKFALGMTCCGLSFILLYMSRFFHDEYGMVSSGWLVVSYVFQGVGELMVSALGVAMVAELVPAKIAGFVMGMWFLTSAVAGFSGAYVASWSALPKNLKSSVDSLMIYTQAFAYIGIATLSIALAMWLLAPYLSRLMGTQKPRAITDEELPDLIIS